MITYNATITLPYMMSCCASVTARVYDVRLAAYLLEPDQKQLSYDTIVRTTGTPDVICRALLDAKTKLNTELISRSLHDTFVLDSNGIVTSVPVSW